MSVLTSTPTNISFPHGTINIQLSPNSSTVNEICGSTDERQDWIIAPTSTAPHVEGFKGYYCARFDYGPQTSSSRYGTVQNSTVHTGVNTGDGKLLSGYALLEAAGDKAVLNLRIGTSFISVDQARRNIDEEAPDHAGMFVLRYASHNPYIQALFSRHRQASNARTYRFTDAHCVDYCPRPLLFGRRNGCREGSVLHGNCTCSSG